VSNSRSYGGSRGTIVPPELTPVEKEKGYELEVTEIILVSLR
jgi:hypothetical protein